MIYHPNRNDFANGTANYGVIGRALVVLSNLEFAHDQLMLSVTKEHPALATKLSAKFPRQYRDKVNFLIDLLATLPQLRTIPTFGASLNLLWLQYQLDELYEVRNVLAHGSIFYSETADGKFLWKFDRITKGSSAGTWTTNSVFLGSDFLADVVNTADILKFYLGSLQLAVEGRFSWETEYKADCEIRKNTKKIREEIDFGIYVADKWLLELLRVQDHED